MVVADQVSLIRVMSGLVARLFSSSPKYSALSASAAVILSAGSNSSMRWNREPPSESDVATTRRKGSSRYDILEIFRFFKSLPLVRIWNWFILQNSRNLPYYVRFSMTLLHSPMLTSYLEAPFNGAAGGRKLGLLPPFYAAEFFRSCVEGKESLQEELARWGVSTSTGGMWKISILDTFKQKIPELLRN